MERKELLHHVDHTLLAQTATWSEIQQICDDGLHYGCASDLKLDQLAQLIKINAVFVIGVTIATQAPVKIGVFIGQSSFQSKIKSKP